MTAPRVSAASCEIVAIFDYETANDVVTDLAWQAAHGREAGHTLSAGSIGLLRALGGPVTVTAKRRRAAGLPTGVVTRQEWLTAKQAAARIGRSEHRVRQLIHDKVLPASQPGGSGTRIRIDAADVEEYLTR